MSPELANSQAAHECYPIRTVSKLTGVNAVTLRAWERRYGLLKPQRTPKGHRLYSEQDIRLINKVLALIAQGIPISLAKQTLRQQPDSTPTRSASATDDLWRQYQERIIAAIMTFDETSLDDIYNEALSLYPVDIVTRLLIVPLLHALGKRWTTEEGSVAEEHFFGVYMRNKLGARLHHRAHNLDGKKLLLACLPGEYHEIGLLLFALAAQTHGFRLVILGADLPLAEIPLTVQRSRSDAVVLTGAIGSHIEGALDGLRQLSARLSAPVFIGGKAAAKYYDTLSSNGTQPLNEDFQLALRQIDQALAGS